MNFKEIYDKIIIMTKNNKTNLIRLGLSSVALLLLVTVLYFSSDKFNVSSEVEAFVTYIENRQYGMAESYYEGLEKSFTSSKIDKFNKKVSKKLSNILVNSGDMYINSQMTKEQYMGLINILNSLNTIEIETNSLIDIGKRVEQMFIEENISYEDASSYLQISSTLRGVNQGLDEFRQQIKTINESREVYRSASKLQSVKKYYEAINKYDKVLKEDKKYYSLAENAKKECIDLMYDYYLEQANYYAQEGKYEEALKYVNYLSAYYDEEKIDKLEEEYSQYVASYTMTSDDILSIIAKKSKEDKKNLSVVSYLQTLNGDRYYYGEILKDESIINEVLINTKDKKVYSYKSNQKDYNCTYSDAFFYIDEHTGEMIFSISEDSAKTILENKLDDKKYKSIKHIKSEDISKSTNKQIDKLIEQNGNVYYFFSVKTGWLKSKEIYAVDMYSKEIHSISE